MEEEEEVRGRMGRKKRSREGSEIGAVGDGECGVREGGKRNKVEGKGEGEGAEKKKGAGRKGGDADIDLLDGLFEGLKAKRKEKKGVEEKQVVSRKGGVC